MEVTSGAEEGFIREWTPCTHILNLIPPRIQNGLFSNELYLTCVDAVSEYIALGTNVGLVYWYDRKKGNMQKLRCEASNSPITYVKIVSTVDYMVGAGNASGQVTVFQIPKEHPENVPDTFKPKVEPKVERYTIGDLHKSKITTIEWSKNGMRLFSGDKNGVIIMTEIDFYMHLCKSMEIVNEEHEIVQMSYCQNTLLVSSVYRTIVCERRDARWHVNQLGKKERKSLCALGAVFQYSYARGGAVAAYCARPGLRLWRADIHGTVHQTLLFKEAVSNPLTVAELLNPAARAPAAADREPGFGPLHVFREHFLVAHDHRALCVLDPRSLTAVAVVDDLRKILSVSVHKEEIFVLEGPRSLVRLAHAPAPPAAAAEEPLNLMTKSLTTSLQQAVNTVRDFAHIDQTMPYISSVLEASTREAEGAVASAEECFELPPIQRLPADIPCDLLESIGNEFRDVSRDVEEIRRAKSEELQRKLKLYSSIMERECAADLIHSRRARRAPSSSPAPASPRVTPRRRAPAAPAPGAPPAPVAYTSPCLMSVSVYGDSSQNDDLLEKQIEEKEKILAKMLNLESLSITAPKTEEKKETPDAPDSAPTYKRIHVTPLIEPEPVTPKAKAPVKTVQEPNPIDLVPKIVQLPNNWNLGNIELKLERTNGFKEARNVMSPEENLDSDWEII